MGQLELGEDKIVKASLGALVFICGLIFGLSAWMATIEVRAETVKSDIQDIKLDQGGNQEYLRRIDKRLERIELLMELLNKQKGE